MHNKLTTGVALRRVGAMLSWCFVGVLVLAPAPAGASCDVAGRDRAVCRAGEQLPSTAFTAQTDTEKPTTSSSFVKSHADVAPGYVYQIDGTFYVNAKPIRFWGVSMGWGGARQRDRDFYKALAHSDIDALVSRLKVLGFNAVRVFPPSSFVFGDLPTGRDRDYAKGDGSLIDKFDYFLYRLKQQNMYVHMSLNMHGPKFLEIDPMFQGPAQEFGAWKAASKEYGWPYLIDQAFLVDKTWEHIKIKNARRVLKHYNKWTGKHYYEDEVFALYEMNNEVRFPERVLGGEIDKAVTGRKRGGMPLYFKRQFQVHWNNYLKQKYGDASALPAGYLKAGESLLDGSVKLAPVRGEAGYISDRARDFVHFVLERYISIYEKIFDAIRTTAPRGVGASVVPINVDSISGNGDSMLTAYATARGGFNSGNGYQHHHYTLRKDARHPYYPYVSMLSLPPEPYGYPREEFHQKRSNVELGRIRSQPFVMYEGMTMTPNIFKAEYFIYNAVLGSWQNHGGYFFYHYAIREHAEDLLWYRGPLRYSKDNPWTSTAGFGRDEVMLSVAWAVGAAFRNFGIKPAPNPTAFVFGRDAIFDPHWRGHGEGTDDWPKTARTAVRYGAELAFEPEAPFAKQIRGSVQEGDFTGPVVAGDGEIVWDWPNSRLIVDTPYAKIYAGVFPPSRRFNFRDGITVENLNRPWGFFVLASDTRDPIATSDKVFMSLVQTSDNAGFKIEPSRLSTDYRTQTGWNHAIISEGSAPVIVERMSADITLPERAGRKLLRRDFDLKQITPLQDASRTVHLLENEPVFQWILVAGEAAKQQQ